MSHILRGEKLLHFVSQHLRADEITSLVCSPIISLHYQQVGLMLDETFQVSIKLRSTTSVLSCLRIPAVVAWNSASTEKQMLVNKGICPDKKRFSVAGTAN